MNRLKMSLTVLISTAVLNSCSQGNNSEFEYGHASYVSDGATEETASSVSGTDPNLTANDSILLNSTAASYSDPGKKFVRTADLSMEVKNVYKSTSRIENSAARLGGFVTKSDLSSNVFSEQTYPVSRDSAVQVRKYRVQNQMTLRIPEQQLSEFLVSLGDEIEFLNYREISCDEVTLDLLLSRLEQQRMKSTAQKLDDLAAEKGKTADRKDVISDSDSRLSQMNRELIGRLETDDKAAFSTVSLTLTEKEKIAETAVVNLKDSDDKYRPGFMTSAADALTGGFRLLQSLAVGLLYLWPIFILALPIYYGLRQYLRKRKTASV